MTPTRRVATTSRRRSEAGDTLVEILFAIVVFGMTSVAAFAGFTTLMSTSAQYRSIATIDTVLKTASTEVVAQLQDQASPLYATCATAAQYQAGGTNAVSFSNVAVPTGYTVQITQVQYWNGSGFSSTCPAVTTQPQPEKITVTVTNTATGIMRSNSFVIDNPYTAQNSFPPDLLATQLVFQQQPGNVASGTNFTPAPTVAVESASGVVLTNDYSIMTMTITAGTGSTGAVLSSTCVGTESSGIFTFANCNINGGGAGYTVTATDGTLSVASNSFNVTTQLAQPLITSTTPSTTAAGQIIVTFTGSSNAPSIQTYSATACTNTAMTTGCVTTGSSFTSGSQIAGLTPGTNYFVTITANASTGYVAATSPASSATMATVQLTAPAITATTAVPSLGGLPAVPALTVAFAAPSNAPTIQTYSATACTNIAMTSGCVTQGAFTSGSQIAGLTLGTSYYVSITAVASTGYLASMTTSGSSTLVPTTVPGAPTNVTAAFGNVSAIVNWTAPISNGGSPITGFTVTATDTSTVGYNCPSGGTLSGTQCTGSTSVAATVVPTMYTCPSGGSLSGSTCTVTSTYAATYGQTGLTPVYGYTCPSGGTLSGTQCTGSSSYAATAKYSCSSGLLSGANCITSTYGTYAVSAAAEPNCQYPAGKIGVTYYCGGYSTNTVAATVVYSCPSGGSLSGSTCYTSSSYGATYGQTGSTNPINGYSCPSGGTLSSITCTTTSTYAATQTNTTYTCPSGGTLSSTTCTVTTTYAANYQVVSSYPIYTYEQTGSYYTTTYTYEIISSTPVYGWGNCYINGLNKQICTWMIVSYTYTYGYVATGGYWTYTYGNVQTGTGYTYGYVCNGSDSLSGTTCTNIATYAATASSTAYSCSSGTLTGSNCVTPILYVATASGNGGQTCTSATTSCTVTGLTNGHTYTFTAVATNINGSSLPSSPSNVVTPATVPNAPTGVSATAGNAQATVTWTAPVINGGSPITGYTVTSSPGGFTCTTTGALTCTVTGLTNGTSYTFTVTATNVVGTSLASSPSSAVTPAGPPSTPSAPTATVASTTSATVAWTAPANNGSTITGYTVTSSPGGLTCTTTGSITCTVTGLTTGTSYTFTVTATNVVGTSAASPASSSIIPAGVPTTPVITGAVVASATSATITWSAPSSNGGSTITGYTVTAAPGGITCTTTSNSCTITGLTTGTSYTFTVTATNAIGTGLPSVSFPATAPSTLNFTPAGATYYLGPTQSQVNTAYSGTPLAGVVTVSGSGIQQWTVPVTGTYTITAAGAQGGTNTADSYLGGNGATMSGTFSLTAGTVIDVVVGQRGMGNGYASGGGGGSFVVTSAGTPLNIAGGGGGAGDSGGTGYVGQTTTSGLGSWPNFVPGTGGNSGASSDGGWGNSGGSFYQNGNGATGSWGQITEASSYATGALGGQGTSSTASCEGGSGGFGGGGAGACNGGGGAGGYSSGAGGGGGAGSYNAGSSQTNTTGNNTGNGYVTIILPAPGGLLIAVTPTAPTGVTAVSGAGSATVTWVAPISNGGATITGYTVSAIDSTTPANGGQTCTTTGALTCTVSGLTAGDSYKFTVTATNIAGTSLASSPSSAVVPTVLVVSHGTTSFAYTGGSQTFTVGAGITSLSVILDGAQGNSNASNTGGGGPGGFTTGTIAVTPGEVLTIIVGGMSGFGGGGGGGSAGGGGGGSFIMNGTTWLAVAGGGGGAGGYTQAQSGIGGGLTGGAGVNAAGQGGTQIAGGGTWIGTGVTPGSLGQGGTGYGGNGTGGGAGGGGGYYGGGGGGGLYGGSVYWGSGGGGSALVPSGGSTVSGVNSGNGVVSITY